MQKPRSGDEVIIRPESLDQVLHRGLSTSIGAIVERVAWGDVLVLAWEHGRKAFVRPEDVTVVRTREQRAETTRRANQAKQLADRASEVVGYYQPESVDQAFSFGRRSAYHKHKQLPKAKFLQLAENHPFPESLWRAYIRGWRQGRRERTQKQS